MPEIFQKGTLYLCPTPIGNLEDITYRTVRCLREADLIAAEDTRHTKQLLLAYDIDTPLTSYHEHNKFTKGPELIDWLLSGHDLICVSDAGLPGICDPGSHLAQLAIEAGIRVSPLPGCNAGLSARICSGLDTTRFTFVGFLPKTAKKQQEVLAEVREHRETLIFYEAPHHLKGTLRQLVIGLGGSRRAAFGRELTKKFEEFRRGTLQQLLDFYETHEPRGEYVLIVEGFSGETEEERADSSEDPVELCQQFMANGLSKKEAMRETAKKLGISRRDVYAALLSAES